MKNVTIKYGVDQINKSVEDAVTVGDLKNNSTIKAVLGYGDNVRALINGVEQADTTQIPAGSVVTLETAANTKAACEVVIQYGVESITKTFDSPPTVQQIKSNPNIKAVLGFGDNVRVLINGVEQPDTMTIPLNAARVVIETKANTKAS